MPRRASSSGEEGGGSREREEGKGAREKKRRRMKRMGFYSFIMKTNEHIAVRVTMPQNNGGSGGRSPPAVSVAMLSLAKANFSGRPKS